MLRSNRTGAHADAAPRDLAPASAFLAFDAVHFCWQAAPAGAVVAAGWPLWGPASAAAGVLVWRWKLWRTALCCQSLRSGSALCPLRVCRSLDFTCMSPLTHWGACALPCLTHQHHHAQVAQVWGLHCAALHAKSACAALAGIGRAVTGPKAHPWVTCSGSSHSACGSRRRARTRTGHMRREWTGLHALAGITAGSHPAPLLQLKRSAACGHTG